MVPVAVDQLESIAFSKNPSLNIQSWDDLRPYKIGVQPGIKHSEIGTKGMNVKAYNTKERLLKALESGYVNLVIMSKVNGLMMIKKLKLKGITAYPTPLVSYPLYNYLHKKHKRLVPKITKALEDMHKEGLIQKAREAVILELIGW